MSPSRLYRWIERKPPNADTLALVFLDDLAEHMVREWSLDELPPAALDGATMVLALAQDDVDEREEVAARYALRWCASRVTVSQTIIKCSARAELTAELAHVEGKAESAATNPQSIASEFIGQILRHKETESRQYFAGMQSVMRAQAEVITQLREHVRELRDELRKRDATIGQEPAASAPEAEARAVALDKLTDMVITHLGPKLPTYVDRLISAGASPSSTIKRIK